MFNVSSRASQVDISELSEVVSELDEGFMVSVVDWATIDADNTSNSFREIATNSSGQLGTKTVTCQGSSGDFMLVHEAEDVFSHVSQVERGMLIGVSEISGVDEPDISVIQNKVIRVGEEGSPV